jgi:uncharacterized membrane protein
MTKPFVVGFAAAAIYVVGNFTVAFSLPPEKADLAAKFMHRGYLGLGIMVIVSVTYALVWCLVKRLYDRSKP